MTGKTVQKLKDEIVEKYSTYFSDAPTSPNAIRSFYDVDRHRFISSYHSPISGNKITVSKDNIDECLPDLYLDQYLLTEYHEETDEPLSSVSQPTLVIYMHSLMEIKEGHNVLEIGTGSGWTAAMLSQMVGKSGKVVTFEISKDLAEMAEERIVSLGYKNIFVRAGDGANGDTDNIFDAIVFTVGVYDIPTALYRQVKEGGILLLVLKNKGGGDTLIKFRKNGDHFVSEEALPCSFVQIQGQLRMGEMQPILLEKGDDELSDLWTNATFSKGFWFGGLGKQDFFWRSAPFRAFLSIAEPYYSIFSKESQVAGPTSEEVYFGVYNKDEFSAAAFYKEGLYSAGSDWATRRLNDRLDQWVRLGMPALASFKVTATPRVVGATLAGLEEEFAIWRDESIFRFSF